ncbi:MAG TPA: hypothetical protein VHB98_11555 [Chloroflexota bacterium]|nr:hypothetical protein [Chloroflexota bacterium]
MLPVITPVLPSTAARQVLAAYGFSIQRFSGPTDSTQGVTATVLLGHRPYRAVLQAQSYGYELTLRSLAAGPRSAPAQSATFDAESNAHAFLRAHGLATDLQNDVVSTVGADTIVTFTTTLSNTYEVAGAGATLTYTPTGVLKAADIHIVDDSTPAVISGISAAAALAEVARGYGLYTTVNGAVLDSTSNVTGATILYVPVVDGIATYLEPVYRFSGVTGSSHIPFAVYVPAIDRSYLR